MASGRKKSGSRGAKAQVGSSHSSAKARAGSGTRRAKAQVGSSLSTAKARGRSGARRAKAQVGRSPSTAKARSRSGTRRVTPRRAERSAAPTTLVAAKAALRACEGRIAALMARVTQLEKTRDAQREAAQRRMTRARQQFEARLTRMVQEIGQLRHHEARARMLEAQLAGRERDAPSGGQ